MSLFDYLDNRDKETTDQLLLKKRRIDRDRVDSARDVSNKDSRRKKKPVGLVEEKPLTTEEPHKVGKSFAVEEPHTTEKRHTVGKSFAVEEPLTITGLTQQIREQIEERFTSIWVIGQISNLSRPHSGHIYLTLKDEGAQLPAVCWKTVASKLRFDLKDGLEVLVRGRLVVYPQHGKYQLVISQLEPKGVGGLELAFRQLHDRLELEGLFDPRKKRPLPQHIRTIAVITSPSGAAIRDFLQVLGRRTARLNVRIIPVKVQGEGAAQEIAQAVKTVNRLKLADCIVLTRGGGSLEDLWSFNEEPLIRAVAGSEIPTISAIGHEIDVTLCDLAADLRALTPSEAAERLSVEDVQLVKRLDQIRVLMRTTLEKRIRVAAEQLRYFENQPLFKRPLRLIEDRVMMLDVLSERIDRAIDRKKELGLQRLAQLAAALHGLSPLAVLQRGYSLTQMESGELLRTVSAVQPGNRIQTRLIDGILHSQVIQTDIMYNSTRQNTESTQ
ncbi:MAG: exodeoxyribonuclease VII large subunit [Thermoguttaceae bacterium]